MSKWTRKGKLSRAERRRWVRENWDLVVGYAYLGAQAFAEETDRSKCLLCGAPAVAVGTNLDHDTGIASHFWGCESCLFMEPDDQATALEGVRASSPKVEPMPGVTMHVGRERGN